MFNNYLLIVFTSCYLLNIIGTANTTEICRTPQGDVGHCIPLVKCDPLNDLTKNSTKTNDELLYLRQSTCGYNNNVAKICCPPKSKWNSRFLPIHRNSTATSTSTATPLPIMDIPNSVKSGRAINISPSECQEVEPPKRRWWNIDKPLGRRIFGGIIAGPDKFPWLSLLEYHNDRLLCGGSLISSRFVLTAAHCINTQFGKPIYVRLGEFNVTTDVDTVEAEQGVFVNITVKKISVERTLVHPNYTRHNEIYNTRDLINDIALIKLSRNAEYTDYIRPICLPTIDYGKILKPQDELITAGWGVTEDSNQQMSTVKRYVALPYVTLEQCREIRPKVIGKQICAGGDLGMDSCKGDSGGPLMALEPINGTKDKGYILVGVVSYGNIVCGTEGSPSVNTYVYEYIDWITNSMVSI